MWEAKVASIVKERWESHFFSPAGKPHTSSWICWLRWGEGVGPYWDNSDQCPFFLLKPSFSFCFNALGLGWPHHGLHLCERPGYGGLYEWELEATAGASDEPHCYRVWRVGERICGVDSLHCGVLGELIWTYLGKSKGSLWEIGRTSSFQWDVLIPPAASLMSQGGGSCS